VTADVGITILTNNVRNREISALRKRGEGVIIYDRGKGTMGFGRM
jgi:hypothetical protein